MGFDDVILRKQLRGWEMGLEEKDPDGLIERAYDLLCLSMVNHGQVDRMDGQTFDQAHALAWVDFVQLFMDNDAAKTWSMVGSAKELQLAIESEGLEQDFRRVLDRAWAEAHGNHIDESQQAPILSEAGDNVIDLAAQKARRARQEGQ